MTLPSDTELSNTDLPNTELSNTELSSIKLSAIELSIFASRIESICEEMGAVLQRTAFSPNIKDRLDYSCAIFDSQGELCAQAAHIPVHMGSMAYAMREIVSNIVWRDGDMIILNDPFMGGTHLPDVTLIAPLFISQQLIGFVVNRAHHADIGSETPGSMPVSKSLEEEGIIISPTLLVKDFQLHESFMQSIMSRTRNQQQTGGDFAAQISANRTGLKRLHGLVDSLGVDSYGTALQQLNNYAQRLARSALTDIPDGEYRFADQMDDDGMGNADIPIVVTVVVKDHEIEVDFADTAMQTKGNINCPLSVAAAGTYYVFRCLMPAHTPNCAGSLRSISIKAPQACLLNAEAPAAVAAGNVETSTRVVDVVLGALAKAIPEKIPAASHGSMNNLAMGVHSSNVQEQDWDYYETIGGGMGASSNSAGLHAVQTHMTNTRNTPIEVIEMNYPLRVCRYAVRRGSGGKGRYSGGNGIIREYEFLATTTVTLLTERRRHQPWGLQQGKSGLAGENWFNGQKLSAKTTWQAKRGDRLMIKTPGGGGWGAEK